MDSIIADSPGEIRWLAPREKTSACSRRFVPFILHEVINVRGKNFHEAQDLATDDKYIGLREWHNQQHRAATSSGPRED